MLHTVIAFSGGIRSGKTSVSSEVANRLGIPRVSFGDHVRQLVHERGGDPEDRKLLQSVGESLVRDKVTPFCRAVLAQARSSWAPGASLIVDGLRHVEAADAMRPLVAPAQLKIVLIGAERDVREARLAGRATAQGLQQWDIHSTEVQVHAVIPQIADLIVNGSDAPPKVVEEILHWAATLA